MNSYSLRELLKQFLMWTDSLRLTHEIPKDTDQVGEVAAMEADSEMRLDS